MDEQAHKSEEIDGSRDDKKSYEAPKLEEHGSLSKIICGGGGPVSDVTVGAPS